MHSATVNNSLLIISVPVAGNGWKAIARVHP